MLGLLNSVSYAAKTESAEIYIKCSKTIESSPWILYKGKPGLQYTLTTKGMKVPNKSELVTDWTEYLIEDENAPNTCANIHAVCGENVKGSFTQMWPKKGSILNAKHTCNKGESIMVCMLDPECKSGEYTYVGVLRKDID